MAAIIAAGLFGRKDIDPACRNAREWVEETAQDIADKIMDISHNSDGWTAVDHAGTPEIPSEGLICWWSDGEQVHHTHEELTSNPHIWNRSRDDDSPNVVATRPANRLSKTHS